MPIFSCKFYFDFWSAVRINKKKKFLYSLSLKKSYNNLVLLVAFIITTTGIFYKDSFGKETPNHSIILV